jgi:hypothetical protein
MNADATDAANAFATRLLADFVYADGSPRLSDAGFAQWLDRLLALPRDEQDEAGVHLLALAITLHERFGAAAAAAIEQLAILAQALALEAAFVVERLAAGGVDVARLATVVGSTSSAIPVSARPRVAGAVSALQLRLGALKPGT